MNKNSRNITRGLFTLVTLIGVFFVTNGVYAEIPLRGVIREQRKEVVKEKIQEVAPNLLERAKNIIKEKVKRQLKGTLTTISGTTLTVQKGEEAYTVLVTEKTELKRKFGASSTLDEFSPNDILVVIGNKVNKEDGTLSSNEIEASYIRNMSIQRRFAVFTGEVTNKTSDTLTLKTVGRGIQTVYLTSNTLYKEKNKAITLADIQIGNKIVVKGELWNRANDKIDAKTILKLSVKSPQLTPSITKTPEQE